MAQVPTLVIDDNKKYARLMREKIGRSGCRIEHMLSSQAGIEHLKNGKVNCYEIIITDITMETQVSGILLTRRIRRMGFKGCLIVYSTGFNSPFVLWISRLFFKLLGADGLIPKDGLLNGRPKLQPISHHPLLKIINSALNERNFYSDNILKVDDKSKDKTH